MHVCKLFNTTKSHYTEKQADEYEEVIVNIRVAVACFSFLGSIFVIALIWLFKKYKFFTQRLILYLSIAAFLSSTAYILGRVDYDPDSEIQRRFCVFQGFWLLYTDWVVLLCVFCITFNLLWAVFTHRRTDKLEPVYFGVCFLFPIAIACVPFIHHSYGPAGAWCWIRGLHINDCSSYAFGKMLQFGLWYIPLYILIVLLFVMCLAIVLKIQFQVKRWQGTYDPNAERQKILLKQEIKPLLYYPTIYLLVCVFPLINRIVYSATGTPFLSLYILHVLTSPLPGAVIALAYSVDRDTLRRLNWHTIKASFQYRNTDDVVREYPVSISPEERLESEPLVVNYESTDKND